MRAEIGKGAKWMVLLRIVDRVFGVASTLVLARLLLPTDFGVVAMATSFNALIELVTAFGFDVVLIQKEKPQRRDYDTAWTLSIALYACCAGLMALLAFPAAAFYREPRLITAMPAIAVVWLLKGFENSGIVDFRRQMNFSREFVYNTLLRLCGVLVTITGAIVMRSYWALIAGMITGRAVGLVLSYVMVPYRPRLDLSGTRELLTFSRWLLINNATLVGVVRLPHFLIGRLLGSQALGLFTVSYDIATLPATELSSPVNRAALPGYSRMREDRLRFKETFLDVGAIVIALALPASAGLVVLAEPLVRVLLGEKWLAAVPIIKILAMSAVLVAATGNNGVGHLALGYPRAVTFQSMLRLIVLLILGLSLAPLFGVVGVTIAELCGAAVCLLASFPVVLRELKISFWEYLLRIWRPIVATAVMAMAVLAVQPFCPHGAGLMPALWTILISVPVGLVVYSLLLIAMWWLSGKPEGTEKLLVNQVAGFLRLSWA